MNLSKREKYLILFFIIILTLFLLYKYIFSPQINKVNTLEKKLDDYRIKVSESKNSIESIKNIDKQIKVENYKISTSTDNIFPLLEQERIILLLNDIIQKSSLNVQNINFSDLDFNPINKNIKEDQSDTNNVLANIMTEYSLDSSKRDSNIEENKDEKEKESIKIENISTTLTYIGDYKEIINFIKLVENFGKKIIIRNITLVDNSGGLAGTITLDFYGVPKIENLDIEYIKVPAADRYGKFNPFYFTSNENYNQDFNISTNHTNNSDFSMTVRPYSSDFPTIILGPTENKDLEKQIYSDNPSVENIEIYFLKKKDKYIYKYKTEIESYPENFSSYSVFNPNHKDITLNIYSIVRNSKLDTSGALVNIYNETDKKVIVKIIKDDPERPRINVNSKKGTVIVNN